MTRCARCCLNKSLRIVNFIMLLFGIAMIAYSLWLERRWNDGIAVLPSGSSLPTPWFIFTCLGLGIAVCFSTLCGHMVSNCISNSSLCMYIVFICCAIFIEVAVIVSIFFKMDWQLINVVVLAVTMCAVGTEPRTHSEELNVPSFTQSFLVPSLPGPAANSSHACRRSEMRFQENPRQSFLSLIMGMLRTQFRRRYTVC